MSTFDGFVKEFPSIRIDHFRTLPGKPPPLACFLSHVHSDHLVGLETLKSPFVYCSAATKRLLLRLEKYPHRINFAKGILEARKKHYRHLRLVLKALPLGTPTRIELKPDWAIRVTLFDANHCPGAVSFLLEGGGKAVLYTGDLRAEPWWVNSIVRNPVLLPFTCGNKQLDCIYLDTTFATHDDIYRHFPSKREGLTELLQKVKSYPLGSTFYFRAWTLGYEDVWIALESALDSKIHVDDYQMRLYRSLVDEVGPGVDVANGSALAGFHAGNHFHGGCLSSETTAKIHSCEPGSSCHSELSKNPNVIWIIPIVSRLADGTEIREAGAGGGWRDLHHVAELEELDEVSTAELERFCHKFICDKSTLKATLNTLKMATQKGKVPLEDLELEFEGNVLLKDFIETLSQQQSRKDRATPGWKEVKPQNIVHFPYSRHSSYAELRDFVSRFKPRDICPCTVDLDSWSEVLSMKTLFGDLCSEDDWFHDKMNRKAADTRKEELVFSRKRKRESSDIGCSQESRSADDPFETANCTPLWGSTPDGAQEKASGFGIGIENSGEGLERSSAGDEPHRGHRRNLSAIQSAFRNLNGGSDTLLRVGQDRRGREGSPGGQSTQVSIRTEEKERDASLISLRTSAFESQRTQDRDSEQLQTAARDSQDMELWRSDESQLIPLNEESIQSTSNQMAATKRTKGHGIGTTDRARTRARKEAYRAAKRMVERGNRGMWDDLGSVEMGRPDHSTEEIEL